MQDLIIVPKENLKYGVEYKLVVDKEFMARNGVKL